MRMLGFTFAALVSAALLASAPARANVVSFSLGNIALQDGGTLSGTFSFDVNLFHFDAPLWRGLLA